MIKTIWLNLMEAEHQIEGAKLTERLRDAGLTAKMSDTEEICHLCLTDQKETAEKIKEKNLPLLFYESAGESYFGADMVVQGLEEIDADFLEAVYRRHFCLPLTIAITNRLVIRESCESDLIPLYELYKTAKESRFICPLGHSIEEERLRLQNYIQNMYGFYGYGLWSVIREEDGILIGRAGLEHAQIDGKVVLQLGYLIRKEEQGKGYAKEACRAILQYARKNLGVNQIYIITHAQNKASLSLAKSLKFWSNSIGLEVNVLAEEE